MFHKQGQTIVSVHIYGTSHYVYLHLGAITLSTQTCFFLTSMLYYIIMICKSEIPFSLIYSKHFKSKYYHSVYEKVLCKPLFNTNQRWNADAFFYLIHTHTTEQVTQTSFQYSMKYTALFLMNSIMLSITHTQNADYLHKEIFTFPNHKNVSSIPNMTKQLRTL